ncbi:MAG: menaquinol-cytochrome C reductase, partial [Dehalococcoidia bacterium]
MAAPPVERTRPAPPPERRARRERDEEVLVWPDLVFVEFIAAVLLTVTLTILSAAISGPLLDKANPDATPNPSKAPWYFLNLQELLLHMHPALAGVVVPTIFLILLAAV